MFCLFTDGEKLRSLMAMIKLPVISAVRKGVQESPILFVMVAELDRSTSSHRSGGILRSRVFSAGEIYLGLHTGRGWFSILLGILIGWATVFIWVVSTGEADMSGSNPGPQGLNTIAGALQQIIEEQRSQRVRMDELGQAVVTAGGAVQMTQAVTEQVVQQVVSHVQAGFATEQQNMEDQVTRTQKQMQPLMQAMQSVQGKLNLLH